MKCALLKLTALALIGAASTTNAHDLRGVVAAADAVAIHELEMDMDGVDEDGDEDEELNSYSWNSRSRRNRNRNYRSRNYRSRNYRNYRSDRSDRTRRNRRQGYTEKGQRRYRRSNSSTTGWKRTAAAKRADRRADRRARRNRCNSRYCLEDLGLYSEDVELMMDFFDDYDDEDVDFIADFLLDELDFDDDEEDTPATNTDIMAKRHIVKLVATVAQEGDDCAAEVGKVKTCLGAPCMDCFVDIFEDFDDSTTCQSLADGTFCADMAGCVETCAEKDCTEPVTALEECVTKAYPDAATEAEENECPGLCEVPAFEFE